MIRITSKREGFRRAGLAHSANPAHYFDDHFTAEQLAALKAEPMLVVEELPDDAETELVVSPGEAQGERLPPIPLQEFGPQHEVDVDYLAKFIQDLDPENKEHWTAAGLPQCDALADLVQQPVSASMRDAAWSRYQAMSHEE
jgi:hypothetical protein